MPKFTDFVPAPNHGTFNGPYEVTIIPAPTGETLRSVRNINVYCFNDGYDAVLKYANGSLRRHICSPSLSSGDTLICGEEDFFVLDSGTSIVGVMYPSGATTFHDFVACWADQV